MALLLLISLLISGGIVVSFYTNNTWRVTNFIIDIPPKFGLLSVSMEDVEEIDALALEATKQYWESDGKLDVDDASGLSYINRYGEMIEGTLIKAQWKWTYIISPLLILFASLTLIGVVYKTFRVK